MSDLPMRWQSLPTRESLTELPLILAGPMLRHTTPESVTVWVALQAACSVTLQIFDTQDNGHQIGTGLFAGSRETIALGTHLHIVAVTATAQGGALTADRIYAYDLTFSQLDRGQSLSVRESSPQLVLMVNMPNLNISYFAHGYPTFILPPNQIADLRIVHGSCRKPHGAGTDALTILDRLLTTTADQPSERPQQLLFTGDQIYADDVADPLLWAASQLSERLLDWTEPLPICIPKGDTNKQPLAPGTCGNRAEIATLQAGFTAGLSDRQEKVSNHLFSFGEYAATYLLTWSPVCWQLLPSGRSLFKHRQAAKHWDRQVQQLEPFIAGLAGIRRALANIPLYTIFDDHEVSDDWNLNQAWCLRVLGQPLGRQVVQNALLAYAICQAWGNTPDRFEPGTTGGKLLAAVQTRSASGGQDLAANLEIVRLVGMPQTDPLTGLPKFVKDGEVSILDRDPEAVSWHYTIESNCHQIIVLDTRTWRGYHLVGVASPLENRAIIEPAMLLSPTAFDRQLIQPLQSQHPGDSSRQTFIVAPTNLFSLALIDWVHHFSLKYYLSDPKRHERIFAADVGDAWNIHHPALARLLTILMSHRDRVVVLSGDIHYGAAARLSYRQMSSNSTSVLIQLTASSFKNESPRTRLLHTRLKDWLFPAKIRYSIGWNSPPQMLPFQSRPPDRQTLPDWECTLTSIERQRAKVVNFVGGASVQQNRTDLTAKNSRIARFLQPLMWWKSGWFQDNREIVGINNLAVVTWQSESIVQDLYWYFPEHSDRLVFSRFKAKLTPGIK